MTLKIARDKYYVIFIKFLCCLSSVTSIIYILVHLRHHLWYHFVRTFAILCLIFVFPSSKTQSAEKALTANSPRYALKGQFHEIWGFFNGYRKSIISRSTAKIFKIFMLCRPWVIQFKRSNVVDEKKIMNFLCK
jgi:hypothetical protein